MRFSISTAFVLLAFSHAICVVSASPVANGQANNIGNNKANTGNNKANNTANNTGKNAGNGSNTGDPQTSLTLDPSVIGANIAQDGLTGNGSEPGLTSSQTSTNNFINACVGKTITDGKQIPTGSCNPIPMGDLISKDKVPSVRIISPTNMDIIKANTGFNVILQVDKMESGSFTNTQKNFLAAPQTINAQGLMVGHTHAVIEPIKNLTDTTPINPGQFTVFQGINNPADSNGQLSAAIAKGLPEGTYRICTLTTNSNHAPAMVGVAQHPSVDDCKFFRATADGKTAAGSNAGNANAGNANAGSNNGTSAANAKAANSAQDASATDKQAKATNSATDAKATNSASDVKGSKSAQATGQNGQGGNQNNQNGGQGGNRGKGGRRRFLSERNA